MTRLFPGGVILFGSLAFGVVLLLGLRDLGSVRRDRRRIVASVLGEDGLDYREPAAERWDRRFRATRRERGRRLDAFVAQMPDIARVLANATGAGLSIHTAVGVAADELEDPARSEMRRVAQRIGFGTPLEQALGELGDRLPSREVAVLTATLVVSARSGGSLVSALRDIADTLEARKETRREIRTTLAQALATGYLVVGMGFGLLLLLNTITPGTVQRMTTAPVGQAALIAAGCLFGGGFLLIRRMTRFET